MKGGGVISCELCYIGVHTGGGGGGRVYVFFCVSVLVCVQSMNIFSGFFEGGGRGVTTHEWLSELSEGKSGGKACRIYIVKIVIIRIRVIRINGRNNSDNCYYYYCY